MFGKDKKGNNYFKIEKNTLFNSIKKILLQL